MRNGIVFHASSPFEEMRGEKLTSTPVVSGEMIYYDGKSFPCHEVGHIT
jgi:hypothetical protein